MSQRQLTIKVGSFKEALEEFKAIWKHAQQGTLQTDIPIETLSFEDPLMLLRTLTPRRLELLQNLHGLGKTSILAIAKCIGRDYSSVYEDIKTLAQAGLVLKDEQAKQYYMPWEKIITEIPMEVKTFSCTRRQETGDGNQKKSGIRN